MAAFEVLSVHTSQGTGEDAAITAAPEQGTSGRGASASGALGTAFVETHAGAGAAIAASAPKLPPFPRA